MKSREILESLQKDIKWVRDSPCCLHLGHRIFDALPILCIAGVQGMEKWISVYQTELPDIVLQGSLGMNEYESFFGGGQLNTLGTNWGTYLGGCQNYKPD